MPQSVEIAELDRMSIKLLDLLRQHDGVALASELRNSLGHDSTRLINYRKSKYLEPAGLIDTRQVESEEPGQIPPFEWSLTEKGLEFLENKDDEEPEYRDLGERVSLLEDQLDGLREQLIELQESFDASGESSGGKEDLQNQVTSLVSELNELKRNPIFDSDLQKQLNGVMIFAGVMKEYLIEELGEDEVYDRFSAKREEIIEFDPSE